MLWRWRKFIYGRVGYNISEEMLFYLYFYSEDWSKVLIRNVNVGSVRKSVYKENILFASFSSVIKTVRNYLSCCATTLKYSSCNTSGFHDTLAGATLFLADVRSVSCVISHLVITTSRFAIVFKLVAAKILPQRWEQKIIPRVELPWYDQNYCMLF